MISETEITFSQGHGSGLSEAAAMDLFATAQAHRIVSGKTTTLADVTNKNGKRLHLGNYVSHLRVPPSSLLARYRLWERVAVAAHTQSYGGLVFSSRYALGRPGELSDSPEIWDAKTCPTLETSGAFWISGRSREPEISLAQAEFITDLPKMGTPPESMTRFREVHAKGSVDPTFVGNLPAADPPVYRIVAGRDVEAGHAVVCTQFIPIMDFAERQLLTRRGRHRLPTAFVDCLAVLERETYLLGQCFADDVLRIQVRGEISAHPADDPDASADLVPAALLTVLMELYVDTTNTLILASRARKLFAVPASQQGSILADAEHVLHNLAGT